MYIYKHVCRCIDRLNLRKIYYFVNKLFDMTFGNRVAKLRDLKGLSQKDLGILVGTGKDMISRYERGAIMPSIEVAGKIAQELGTTLDFLVFGTQEHVIGENESLRLQEIVKLPEEDKKHVWAVVDAFVTKAKLQNILQ